MSTFVFPVGRVVSSDSLVGADTAVGDLLVDSGAGAVSLRAQDPATGAPVDVVLAPQGGGVNPGTPGTLPKYDLAGTNVVDSQVREGPKSVELGPVAGARLGLDWTAGASLAEWRNSLGAVRLSLSEAAAGGAGAATIGVPGGSRLYLTPGAGVAKAVWYDSSGSTIFELNEQNATMYVGPAYQLRWNYALGQLTLYSPVGGSTIVMYAATGEISSSNCVPVVANTAISADGSGILRVANGQTTYPYTANGANWQNPKPDNVHSALDRIATALAGLLGNPIP